MWSALNQAFIRLVLTYARTADEGIMILETVASIPLYF